MQKSRFLVFVVSAGTALCLAVALLTYHQTKQGVSFQLRQDVNRLEEKLSSELARHSEIPAVLSADPRLIRLIRVPDSKNLLDQTNLLLSRWQTRLDADTIYLMDKSGTTLAASNWNSPRTFVGQNYSYRPYFQQALEGQKGRYYALGTRSDKRGYYFSYPVYESGQIAGVLVLKVDLSIIEQVWPEHDFDYVIADPLGVVFYSSRKDWLYQALIELTDIQKQAIRSSRRYGDTALTSLSHYKQLDAFDKRSVVSLGPEADNRQSVLTANNPIGDAGWRIYGFTPVSGIIQLVFQSVVWFSAIYILLVLVVAAWLQTLRTQRQLSDLSNKLERQVLARTESLEQTNRTLRDTLTQYEHSQAELRQTQNELVQTAKLAMLGEMSAGINHEFNQPLSAMRTYTENSHRLLEKGRYDHLAANLSEILKLIAMVSEIVARFKVFARKSNQSNSAIAPVDDTLHAALSITNATLIKVGIQLKMEKSETGLLANADPIQLEQVVINLITNAIHALSSTPSPQICVSVETGPEKIRIYVSDNGRGMDNELKKKIFSPFFTTKKEGLGLGLTISRRIIEAFSGTLTLEDNPTGGAVFIVTLQRRLEEETL